MTERDANRDDEALSALLDGELAREEAQRLRRRIAEDPALARRLGELEHADLRVRDAYAGIAEEPLPRRLTERLRDGGEGAAAGDGEAGGKVLRFPRLERWQPPRSLPAAAAAALALAVGLLIGLALGRGPAGPQDPALLAGAGTIEPGTPLYEVFERVPSATTHEVGAGVAATPRLTFRTADGDYCRQVDWAGGRGGAETLACRRGGEWRLEVVAYTGQAGRSEPGDGRFRPASGAATAVGSAIEARMDGAPLGAEAERALIAGRWEGTR